MVEKARPKRDKSPSGTDATGNAPGQLGVDDRGNMTWQWREDDDDLLTDDTVGKFRRVRALVDPAMKVVDDGNLTRRSKQPGIKGPASGYNPYNSGPVARSGARKKKDLRKFSEWIALRNKLEGKGRKK